MSAQPVKKVEKLGKFGEGIAEHDGKPLFIEGALPGEIVRVAITKKGAYAKGDLLEIVEHSPDRVTPICPVFDRCGGCQVMHLDYEGQLELKKRVVAEALPDFEVADCLPSPEQFAYRNKIVMPEGAGLYAARSHDIVPIRGCPVHCDEGERVVGKVREVVPRGELRYLAVRTTSEGVLVVFVTRDAPSQRLKEAAVWLDVASVFHNVNDLPGNAIFGEKWARLAGEKAIEHEICGVRIALGPRSFFQVNSGAAERLYHKAVELANLQPTDRVLDLYCGVGALTLLIAQKVAQVRGIEIVKEAVELARHNAKINGINNCFFADAAVEEARLEEVDVTFVNPPRKGCEPAVLQKLQSKKIVYISCNPTTLARDVAVLKERGYQVAHIQPVDLFPQTLHVETIVVLV